MLIKDWILLASVGVGTSALILALLNLNQRFVFNQDLRPTQSGSFTVGTSQYGVSGVWFGSYPDKLFLDSLSNHFFYGNQSITTFLDLQNQSYSTQQSISNQSYTTQQYIQNQSYTTQQSISNQSYTTQQYIQNQSYTSQQYIQNQSFSKVQGVFTPSLGTFYSTENQYMGLVTTSANISSASAFYYNYSGLNTSDIHCSVSKASPGGNSLSGDSKVYVQNTGIYKIGTSIQFDQTANQVTPIAFWLKINGTDVPETGSIQTIVQANGETVPYMEYLTSLTSNSYFEIMWKSFETSAWAAKFVTSLGIGSTSNVNSPSVITNIYRIA